MKRLFYLSILTLALSGCKKENEVILSEGTYSGTFRNMLNNKQQVTDFELTLFNKRFTTTKGGVGRGPFELFGKNMIKFTDELTYTAYFDLSSLLTGEYSYEIKGDSLILNKRLEKPIKDYYYQYRLKKLNKSNRLWLLKKPKEYY